MKQQKIECTVSSKPYETIVSPFLNMDCMAFPYSVLMFKKSEKRLIREFLEGRCCAVSLCSPFFSTGLEPKSHPIQCLLNERVVSCECKNPPKTQLYIHLCLIFFSITTTHTWILKSCLLAHSTPSPIVRQAASQVRSSNNHCTSEL